MDAARTALRLGAHVEIVYSPASELPARHEEVVHAQKKVLPLTY